MNKIQGLCYILHIKDYFKYQPTTENDIPFADENVYVCESRYNIKTKMFKKSNGGIYLRTIVLN